VLRALGYRIENCAIASSCFIGGLGLSIGENTFINHGVLFDCSAPISIGKRCDVGPRVTMITGSHKVGGSERRAGPKTAAPISIGDGAWIGASCTILPGVTIGRGAVIAAGSVVTRDCLPDTLYAGVPARRIRDIEALVAAHD
jgi:maltose O-acetyltransferase